jgi:hypothetical protein
MKKLSLLFFCLINTQGIYSAENDNKTIEQQKRTQTDLHKAVLRGNSPENVKELLEKGFDANQPDQAGNTPLHYAAQFAKPDIVKVLVEEGDADAENINDRGDSPIIFAQESLKTKRTHFQNWGKEEIPGEIEKLEKIIQYLHDHEFIGIK